MTSVTARSSLAMTAIVLLNLAATAPAWSACGHKRVHRAQFPPCGSLQVWDTQYQRCLSFSAKGPPDQKPWQLGPRWDPGNRDYDSAMSMWN